MSILYYCAHDTDNRILKALQQKLPEHKIYQWPDCDDPSKVSAAIVWQPPTEFFDGLSNLKYVLSIAAGVDHLLNHPGLPAHVEIARLTDAGMARPMSEFALYGALHAQRKMTALAQAQRQHQWRHDIKPHLAQEFRIGILGAGELGQITAKRLLDNNYPVSCWSRTEKDLQGIQHYVGESGLNEMLPTVQALICLLPLTNDTRGIINSSLLSKLPKNAFLINPGRGAHLDENALIEALDSDHLSGALLDVFCTEPLPETHAFWSHEKIIVTPHVAAVTSLPEAVEQISESLVAFEKGEIPRGLVNREHNY